MGAFDDEVRETRQYMDGGRFKEITRLYTARQVVEQRGVVETDYTVARRAAEDFYALLRERVEPCAPAEAGPFGQGAFRLIREYADPRLRAAFGPLQIDEPRTSRVEDRWGIGSPRAP